MVGLDVGPEQVKFELKQTKPKLSGLVQVHIMGRIWGAVRSKIALHMTLTLRVVF